MLLVVIDSSYDIQTQLDTIDKALDDIDIGEKKIIYVFNKIGGIEDEILLLGYKNKEEKIYITARDKDDIVRLKDKIVDVIKNDYIEVKMKIPYEDGKVLDYIMTNYDIDKKDYDENSSILEFDISKKDYNKYERYIEKN